MRLGALLDIMEPQLSRAVWRMCHAVISLCLLLSAVEFTAKLGCFPVTVRSRHACPLHSAFCRCSAELCVLHSANSAFCRIAAVTTHLCRLVKSGVLSKRHQPRITLISAWAELVRNARSSATAPADAFACRRFCHPSAPVSIRPQVGYSGSIAIGALTVWACLEREAQLSQQLRLVRKVSDAAQAAS